MRNDTWFSFEATRQALQIMDFEQLTLVQANGMKGWHVPSFPPSAAALLLDLYGSGNATSIKHSLLAVYPASHRVKLVHFSGDGSSVVNVEDLALENLEEVKEGDGFANLYVPCLAAESSFEAFQEVVAHLRAPDGCPWDLKQTHQSLRSHLLSETYEVLAALDEENVLGMCEELGDLLLQIVLHAQIAADAGEFRMADVLKGVHTKIVYRHPHVFGDLKLGDVEGVLQNWEKLKAAERANRAKGEDFTTAETPKGLLDGVPLAVPALVQAQEYLERVERVKVAWLPVDELARDIHHYLDELQGDMPAELRSVKIGEVLFYVMQMAAIYHVDAESALRQINLRFRQRIRVLEREANEQGKPLSANLNAEEKRAIWKVDGREDL